MSTNKYDVKKEIETRFIITQFSLPKDYPGTQKKRKLRAYGVSSQQMEPKATDSKDNGSQSKYKANG